MLQACFQQSQDFFLRKELVALTELFTGATYRDILADATPKEAEGKKPLTIEGDLT